MIKIYDLVKNILTDSPECRNSDKHLMWTVWHQQRLLEQNEYGNHVISATNFLSRAVTPESITRARRKVQQDFPKLASTDDVKIYKTLKEQTKGEFIHEEEVYTKE